MVVRHRKTTAIVLFPDLLTLANVVIVFPEKSAHDVTLLISLCRAVSCQQYLCADACEKEVQFGGRGSMTSSCQSIESDHKMRTYLAATDYSYLE